MRPADDLEPLQRMDPLTRGSLFHAVQASFYRRVKQLGALPIGAAHRDRALAVLDEALADIAAREYEQLAPAIDRIWNDEIAAIRRDLRLWVDEIADNAAGAWTPKWFEWSFGLNDAGRDEESRAEEVVIDGRFRLHGSIDLVEERANGDLRVTDHKTGKYRGKDHMIVDGGAALQPVLYSMALEAATGRPVVEGRLYYATTDGGYRDVQIPLTPPGAANRRRSAGDHRPGGRDRFSRAGAEGKGVLLVRLQTGVRPDAQTSDRPVQIARAARRSPRAAEEAVTDMTDWQAYRLGRSAARPRRPRRDGHRGGGRRNGQDDRARRAHSERAGHRPRAHRPDRRRDVYGKGGRRAEAADQAGARDGAPAGGRSRRFTRT